MNTCPKDRDPHSRSAGLAAAVAAVVLAGLAPSASAGSPAPAAAESLNWHGDPKAPDLSGVWVRIDLAGKAGASKEGWLPWPPPLRGPFATIWNKRVADAAAGKRTDDPVRGCMPPGMPRYMTGTNGPLLIMQTPGRVVLYRDGDPVRRIWLDGRSLPKPADLEYFSNGNARGHYEGADLVTEIIGVKDEPIDSTGIPHSDDLKIAERFHRLDAKTLTVAITLTDPKAYTRPMTSTVTYKSLDDPLWEPKEFLCEPNSGYHPDVYVH